MGKTWKDKDAWKRKNGKRKNGKREPSNNDKPNRRDIEREGDYEAQKHNDRAKD